MSWRVRKGWRGERKAKGSLQPLRPSSPSTSAEPNFLWLLSSNRTQSKPKGWRGWRGWRRWRGWRGSGLLGLEGLGWDHILDICSDPEPISNFFFAGCPNKKFSGCNLIYARFLSNALAVMRIEIATIIFTNPNSAYTPNIDTSKLMFRMWMPA